MERPINEVLRTATIDYLDGLDINNPPTPAQIETELLHKIKFEFEIENAGKEKKRHWRIPDVLGNATIAQIIFKLHNVIRIMWTESDDNYDLAIYQTAGANAGVYVTERAEIEQIIIEYNDNIDKRGKSEVIDRLLLLADGRNITADRDLIAVNNGIFNYVTKELLPFSPDMVFTSKSAVNYNPNARNTVIHNLEDGTDWDVESWVDELSDDNGVTELIWQAIGAVIRPHVAWNKVVCFYAEKGNNGKGTLCALMRNLCGAKTHAVIPFAAFSQRFALTNITRTSAIIVDENDTNDFTRATANLKAIITGDYLLVDRKNRDPITARFRGVMIQCINALPKFGDKSDSMYRRFLLIPFNKCFTNKERKYIKEDYLCRSEVLEYVLCKILHSDYYEFSNPAVCEELLNIYKINNDTIRQFVDEVFPVLAWDLVPYQFLYDLYRSWHGRNNPSGTIINKNGFTNQIRQVLENDDIWSVGDAKTTHRVKTGDMDKPEPLISQYDLKDWYSKSYKGNNINDMCQPDNLAVRYRGLRRK